MTADEVRTRIESGWSELDQLAGSLDEEALSSPGPDGWAIKDHLVHVGAWELWLLAMLERRDRLAAMGVPGANSNVDDVNAVVWELHRHDTAPDALAYFRDAHTSLMGVVAGQSTEDLERSYRPSFGGQTEEGESNEKVLGAVAGSTYEHYTEHIDWIRARTGKTAPH